MDNSRLQPPHRAAGNFDDWNTRIGTLKGLYERIRDISGQSEALTGATRGGSRLESTGSVFDRETFRVMVLGEFSSGKSTLINAMLGKKLLPTKANPTTAFTTLLRWGAEEAAELYRTMDRQGPVTVVSTQKFQEEVSLQIDARGAPRSPSFALAVVSHPLELLQNSVEIVDSAGMNEDPERELVTLGFLEEVDAVIYVTDAVRPFTLHETQNYLDHVYRLGHRDIFYVVNRIDLIDEDEREEVKSRCRNEVAELGRDLGGQPRKDVYFLSARDALRARVAGDRDAIDASGITALEKDLELLCDWDSARVKFVRLAEYLRHTTIGLRRSLQEESGALRKSATELRRFLDQNRSTQDLLQQNEVRIRDVVESWAVGVETDIRDKFTAFLVELSTDVPGWEVQGLGRARRMTKALSAGGRDHLANQIIDGYTSQLQREMQVFCSVDLEKAIERHQAELLKRLEPLVREYQSSLDEMRAQLTGVRAEQSDHLLQSLALSASRGGLSRVQFEDVPFRFRPGSVTAIASGVGVVGAGGVAAGMLSLGIAMPPLGIALAIGAALGPVLGAASFAVADGKLRAKAADHFAAQLKQSAKKSADEYARSRGAVLRGVWSGVSDALSERLQGVLATVKRSIDESSLDEREKQARRDELFRYEQELTDIEGEIGEFLRPYVSEASRE